MSQLELNRLREIRRSLCSIYCNKAKECKKESCPVNDPEFTKLKLKEILTNVKK